MIYKAQSQETIFDIAAKLYNGDTSLGVGDLLSLNQGISLNSDLQGIPLTYTDGLRRNNPIVISVIPIISQRPTYRVGLKQSIYDLAVQLFGNQQKLADIIGNFTDLNNEIAPGSTFLYTPSIDPIALLFAQRNVVVATSVMYTPPFSGFRRLLETGSYRLLETGDFRLLE